MGSPGAQSRSSVTRASCGAQAPHVPLLFPQPGRWGCRPALPTTARPREGKPPGAARCSWKLGATGLWAHQDRWVALSPGRQPPSVPCPKVGRADPHSAEAAEDRGLSGRGGGRVTKTGFCGLGPCRRPQALSGAVGLGEAEARKSGKLAPSPFPPGLSWAPA